MPIDQLDVMYRALLACTVALLLATSAAAGTDGGDDGFFLDDSGHSLETDADADHYTGPAPLTVSFTVKAINATGGIRYAWSFDDRGTSTDQNPTHTFKRPGWYAVTMDARDGKGQTYRNNLLLHVWRPRDWARMQQQRDMRIVARAVRELKQKNANPTPRLRLGSEP